MYSKKARSEDLIFLASCLLSFVVLTIPLYQIAHPGTVLPRSGAVLQEGLPTAEACHGMERIAVHLLRMSRPPQSSAFLGAKPLLTMPGGLLQQRIAMWAPFGSCNRCCLRRKAVCGVPSAKGFDRICRQTNCGCYLAIAHALGTKLENEFSLLLVHTYLPLQARIIYCGS